MSEMDKIYKEQAEEVYNIRTDRVEEIEEAAEKEAEEELMVYAEMCLDEALAAYAGDDRNYVVDGAEIECSKMSRKVYCMKYENGKTKLYNIVNPADCVERDSISPQGKPGEKISFGKTIDISKVRKLTALHAESTSDNGIRFATVSDRECLRNVGGDIEKANIISCGNCGILRETDIAEIEKSVNEAIEYGTCYSLIKPVTEWTNPFCTEILTGQCDNKISNTIYTGGTVKTVCIQREHHKTMKFDTDSGQKEGLTMLSTLLCTRGGVITIKTHGQISFGTYNKNLIYRTVTGATLVTDSRLNPQGLPLYSGRTMNGNCEYVSLTAYDQAKYANVAISRDKTWGEGFNYSYIHPLVWPIDLPTSFNQDYHGTFISNGITFSMADNRIEIACRKGISTCDGEAFDASLAGKYIDIELSDGTVLACIIGASKGDEEGSDSEGIVHHDDSIFELLETEGEEGRVQREDSENADKEDLLHGCDIVGAYVYSEKRLYDSTTGEYTYYFSESLVN